MAHEALTNTTIVAALRDLFADGKDLVRKELRLAKAELTQKLSAGLGGAIWIAVAAVLMVIAGLLLIQAAVFGIAALGIALHWSCLIVAAVLCAVAAGSFFYGRTKMRGSLLPDRTMAQLGKDMRVVGSN
jgi:ABC-type multidrug transport system permease subunit